MRSHLFSSKGVTIIELLLVILILSMLAGFSIPQMQKVATRQEFVSDVDYVMDDFKIAQSWARNSILEQENSKSVVAYQIVKETNGYAYKQKFADGSDKKLSSTDLTEKNIEITTWPGTSPNEGFEFKVPSGRTSALNGDVILSGVPYKVVFLHTGLNETIDVTIDPSGTISR